MARTAYDPGTATRPVKVRPGYYSIDSFRGEEKSYTVSLAGNVATCSCPDHQKRQRDCKHIKAVRAARFSSVVEKAKGLTDTELQRLLPRYEAADLAVAVAIRAELMARQQVTA